MSPLPTEQILGIRFFNGSPSAAVECISESGGLVVAPSGTCFERFLEDNEYRRAIRTAYLILPDSGFMVSLWRARTGRKVNRISGLAYLKELAGNVEFRSAETFWVLPNEQARSRFIAWAGRAQLDVDAEDIYVAPMYAQRVSDPTLLARVLQRQPQHIIIGIGAGPQEKLGWYLRENAGYRPAIHCIGGALGFLTGDQVEIPDWADRTYLGWLLRLLSQPRVFVPRLWRGRILPGLVFRYAGNLPPLRG